MGISSTPTAGEKEAAPRHRQESVLPVPPPTQGPDTIGPAPTRRTAFPRNKNIKDQSEAFRLRSSFFSCAVHDGIYVSVRPETHPGGGPQGSVPGPVWFPREAAWVLPFLQSVLSSLMDTEKDVRLVQAIKVRGQRVSADYSVLRIRDIYGIKLLIYLIIYYCFKTSVREHCLVL